MLANWFKQVFADTDTTPDANKTALAAIGLVTEVIHADQRCSPEELVQLRSIALDTFAVEADQVDELIAAFGRSERFLPTRAKVFLYSSTARFNSSDE